MICCEYIHHMILKQVSLVHGIQVSAHLAWLSTNCMGVTSQRTYIRLPHYQIVHSLYLRVLHIFTKHTSLSKGASKLTGSRRKLRMYLNRPPSRSMKNDPSDSSACRWNLPENIAPSIESGMLVRVAKEVVYLHPPTSSLIFERLNFITWFMRGTAFKIKTQSRIQFSSACWKKRLRYNGVQILHQWHTLCNLLNLERICAIRQQIPGHQPMSVALSTHAWIRPSTWSQTKPVKNSQTQLSLLFVKVSTSHGV